jgi:hypothetical protein
MVAPKRSASFVKRSLTFAAVVQQRNSQRPRQLDPAANQALRLVGGTAYIAGELGDVHHLLRSADSAKLTMSFFDEFGDEGAIDAPGSAATTPQRRPSVARSGTLTRLLVIPCIPPLRSVPWTGTGLKEIGNRSKGRSKKVGQAHRR